MQRRSIISACAALGTAGSVFTLPGAALSQPAGKIWRIGYLSSNLGPTQFSNVAIEQLRHLGYVEGRNLVIEYRWAGNRDERMQELAAELVRLNVDLIYAQTSVPAVAAMRATQSIPIVFGVSGDPVGLGLVASLAKPGGNVTGLTNISSEIVGKRLQLLRELLPRASPIAVLAHRGLAMTTIFLEQVRMAARPAGIELTIHQVGDASELADAFAAMQLGRAQALLVQGIPFTFVHLQRIVDLAAQQRIPAAYETREFIIAGGLICYGANVPEIYRRAATYVDKIFKGAKPADLPVEQPTKFDLVLNLKTAKALGLTVPYSLRLQATEVIE